MAYRIDLTVPLEAEIRRILAEELRGAAAKLRRRRKRDDAIHEARKHLKKARALLRLVRPLLGGENGVCREAAHLLASARDAAAMVEAVARLREASPNPAAWDALLARFNERNAAHAQSPAAQEQLLAAIEGRLRGVESRLRSWRELPGSLSELAPGALRVATRGRERFRVAIRNRDPEAFHAWRKRAKDLWYHARLLHGLGPLVAGMEATLDRLADVLGQRHDLDVLEALTAAEPELLEGSDRDGIRTEIASLRARLDAEAAVLGELVYDGGAPVLERLLSAADGRATPTSRTGG